MLARAFMVACPVTGKRARWDKQAKDEPDLNNFHRFWSAGAVSDCLELGLGVTREE